MKSLRKIKLINWHFFDDATFDVVGNIVIFGENGCGKSTVIDAIHYLLSGGNCNFNKAANSGNSSRSVFSYMKARIGAETEEYARPEPDIISHISLEFIDTENGVPLVVGVVLQISADQEPTNRFYWFKGSEISDSLFYSGEDKQTILNGDAFFDSCMSKGIVIQSLDGDGRLKTCQDKMNGVLEVASTYPTLLEKAISFSDLGNIDDFARKFLFKEDPLSIDELVKPALEYQQIKKQLEQEKMKAAALEPVSQYGEKYKKVILDKEAYGLIIAKENLALSSQELKAREAELQKQETILKNDEEEKKSLQTRKDAIEERYRQLSVNNPSIDHLLVAENNMNSAALSLKATQESLDTLTKYVKEETTLSKALGLSLSLEESVEKKDYNAFLSVAHSYKTSLDNKTHDLISVVTRDQQEQGRHKKEYEDLQKEINSLNQNINCPEPVQKMIGLIKEGALKHGADESTVYAIPLLDVVEVKDEAWRPILETIIGVNRFDLIVPTSIFDMARSIYNNNKDLHGYFGFGVIDQNALVEVEASPSSLSSLLSSSNAIAEKYIRMLLEGIEISSDQVKIKPGEKSITKEGLFYDGKSIRLLTKEMMDKPYLGQGAKKLLLATDMVKQKEIGKVIEELEAKIKQNESLLSLVQSTSKISDILKWNNVFYSLAQAKGSYDSASHQVEILKNDSSLLSAKEALDAISIERDALKKETWALDRKRSLDDVREGQIKNQISVCHDSLSKNESYLATIEKSLSPSAKSLDLEAYKNGLVGPKLIAKSYDSLASLDTERVNLEKSLTKIFGEYNSSFGSEISATIDSLDDYLSLFTKTTSIDIIALLPKAEEAHKSMEKVFKETFANSIMDKIKTSKDTASRLNSVLRKYQFGAEKETYQLVVKTTESDSYKDISAIFDEMSGKLYGANSFYDSIDEKERQAFDNIFNVLLDNQSGSHNSKLIMGYCDYRNYMDYDIKITPAEGKPSSYKHNQNSYSGGETQTPFYVLVAAAFGSGFLGRVYQKSSPCGLVILDEAFNNMDENRIKEMLEFYKQLDIQLIISVPTTRSALLTGKVDTSIALVRRGIDVSWYITYHE